MKKTCVLLAYSTTGLGHLRVTNALFEAAPIKKNIMLFKDEGESSTALHRITSTNPVFRAIMEWFQKGPQEKVLTFFYRKLMNTESSDLKSRIEKQIKKSGCREIIFISTHFGLAQQFAQIKHDISLPAKLVVVVTDDSPQRAWLVKGADITFVPSYKTKRVLEKYRKEKGWKPQKIQMCAYPVGSTLSGPLSSSQLKKKQAQVMHEASDKAKMLIPVSGAAVGLNFTKDLVKRLSEISDKYEFAIVSKSTAFTRPFLKKIGKRENVEVFSDTDDREVVKLYDKVITDSVFAFEITKPSEQSFKALIDPKLIGGVALLLTQPVGRQEYDNLNFLIRHHLAPNEKEQEDFFGKFSAGAGATEKLVRDSAVRAIRLPKGASEAAEFIDWGMKQGVFSGMVNSSIKPHAHDKHADEIRPDGAKLFWEKLSTI